jgi:hypothetical protein
MSWFDTKQLTSFAKTALTEAQKTLDKALDIDEEGQEQGQVQDVVQPSEDISKVASVASKKMSSVAASASAAMANSKVWGSFTGSFFEASQVQSSPEEEEAKPEIEAQEDEDSSVIAAQPSTGKSSKSDQAPNDDAKAMSTSAVMEEATADEVDILTSRDQEDQMLAEEKSDLLSETSSRAASEFNVQLVVPEGEDCSDSSITSKGNIPKKVSVSSDLAISGSGMSAQHVQDKVSKIAIICLSFR